MTTAAPAAAPASAPSPAGSPGTPAPGQQPTSPKPGETPAQAEARRLKFVLDGKEVEISESEVVAKYKRGEHAQRLLSEVDKRRAEALKTKAEADGLLSKLKDKGNLRSVLRELGYTTEDIRKMSEEEILDAIEEEKLSKEEKRVRELEAKLREREDADRKTKEEEDKKAHEAEVERHKDQLANLFLAAMEATGLPKSSGVHVLPRIARLYAQNEAAGLETTDEEVSAHVLAGLKAEHQGVLSGLEGEALAQYLGPDVVKKVLAHHLSLARAKRGMGAPTPKPAAAPIPEGRLTNPRLGRWEQINELLK